MQQRKWQTKATICLLFQQKFAQSVFCLWYNVCMTVYIEYVVLDNLSVDLLLLWASAVTLGFKCKWHRLLLGAFVGTICAVASVFLTDVLALLLKTVTLVAMCFAVVGWGKQLFWMCLTTLVYTFLFGGAIVGIFNLANVDYSTANGVVYLSNVPIFVYVLAVLLVAFLCYSLVVYVNNAKKIAPFLVDVVLHLNKDVALVGFCDSGNSLVFQGLPVCFVTKKHRDVVEFFSKQVLLGNAVQVPVQTIASQTTVLAVPCAISACGKRCNVLLALPSQKCQTTYHVLLSNDFLEGHNETTATTCQTTF